jgi:signal transduction histidine kinase
MPRTGGSGAAETEIMLVRAAVLYRLFGISQLALGLALNLPRYTNLPATFGLAAAVSVESVAGSVCIMGRRRLIPWMITADTGLNMLGLVLCALWAAPDDDQTWVFYMYPFSMVSAVAIGLAHQRLRSVLAVTACLTAAYIVAADAVHHDPAWNTLPNCGSYFANTVVAWAVARYVREAGVRIDGTAAQATDRAAALAAERERLRHARLLHDRVLQTMETLAQGDWISDSAVRGRVAAEAAWVRGLVEGFVPSGDDDLATGLQRLISDGTGQGLRIEFNATQLLELGDTRHRLAPEAVRALVDAAREALTNVAKHSGTGAAMMRVRVTEDRLAVSVLDHGRGFDVATVPRGVGLRESIEARLLEVGGGARIESTLGQGTFVDLSVPWQQTAVRIADSRQGEPAEVGNLHHKALSWLIRESQQEGRQMCPVICRHDSQPRDK